MNKYIITYILEDNSTHFKIVEAATLIAAGQNFINDHHSCQIIEIISIMKDMRSSP